MLLVDDHALVLRGLAQVLQECVPDSEVEAVGSAAAALESLERRPADVALVDIRMPDRDGLDLLREIRERWPDTPVIVLTSYDHGEYVKRALADGAAGYLLKDATPEDLAQAITVARSGSGNVLSPRAIQNLFNGSMPSLDRDDDRARPPDGGLTRREWDILNLLSEGHSNREISEAPVSVREDRQGPPGRHLPQAGRQQPDPGGDGCGGHGRGYGQGRPGRLTPTDAGSWRTTGPLRKPVISGTVPLAGHDLL